MSNVYLLTHDFDGFINCGGIFLAWIQIDLLTTSFRLLHQDMPDGTPDPAPSTAPKLFPFKPKAAAEASAPTNSLDLFAARNTPRQTEEDKDASYAALAEKAAEALSKTVNLDVNAATPSAASGSAAEPAPKPVWTKKYGPYDDPNLLLVDIFRQLAHDAFEDAKFDQQKKWGAQAYNTAQLNMHAWPKPILDGKKAQKEIDKVGASSAKKIDEILKEKCYTTSEGKVYHPLGNVLPKDEELAIKAEEKDAKEAAKKAEKAKIKEEKEAIKAEARAAAGKPEPKKRKKTGAAAFVDANDEEPVKAEVKPKVKDEKPKVKEEPITIDDSDGSDTVAPVKAKDEKKPAAKKQVKKSPPPKKAAAKGKGKDTKGKKRKADSDESDEDEASMSGSDEESPEEEAEETPSESEDSDAPKKKRKLIRK